MSKSTRKRKTKSPPPRPHRFRRWLIWSLVKMGIVVVLLWSVIGLAYYAYALTFDLHTISEMPQRSTIYDYQGKYYSRLAGENRIVVPFDKVSNDFVNALLAREDTRFYFHHGIDPIGISRAIVRNFIGGGFREGASTITQQLARNSFPLGGKNFNRKLVEAALAYRIETELSKEEILSAYMNRIYFGSGYYGVETASQAYFGKPASRMNVSEAATLAGLIRSPNRFSPFNNLEGSTRERNTVLKRMLQLELITQDQYDTAFATVLEPPPRPLSAPQESWAVDSILHDLELAIDQDPMDIGGLKIYTTIDGQLQNAAEASVGQRLTQIEASPKYPHKAYSAVSASEVSADQQGTPYLQAAAIALDNKSGGIRAIVGGRDFQQSRFNRALLGRRQIGSAVKPFVYAKAFEAGLRPGDPVDDNRLHRGDLPRSYGDYNPNNSDNTYRGIMPASEGLVLSRNTMSVRVGYRAGFDKIADTIIRAGIASNPPRYPAICLGAFEANLKDLTAAYTVFATGGTKVQPYLIEKVLDADNKVLYRATHGRLAVLPPGPAAMTTSIMEDVLNRGTGARSHALGLRHRAAGKTGTTNEYQDAWFIGFDDRLTCGVWVGFDRPLKIMPGGTGAELALPIWVDIVEAGR